MNAYTTPGRANIQPRNFSALLRSNGLAGASPAEIEWQRECQAKAVLAWRLKQNGGKSNSSASRVSLRQTFRVALVRAGERLVGVPRNGVSLETARAAGTIGMGG